MDALSADAIRNWLNNHKAAIAAGYEPGQIARDKAQRFSLELIRRGESLA